MIGSRIPLCFTASGGGGGAVPGISDPRWLLFSGCDNGETAPLAGSFATNSTGLPGYSYTKINPSAGIGKTGLGDDGYGLNFTSPITARSWGKSSPDTCTKLSIGGWLKKSSSQHPILGVDPTNTSVGNFNGLLLYGSALRLGGSIIRSFSVDSNWHHYVAIANFTNSSGALYIDGVLDWSGSIVGSSINAGSFFVYGDGSNLGYSDSPFAIKDDVRDLSGFISAIYSGTRPT